MRSTELYLIPEATDFEVIHMESCVVTKGGPVKEKSKDRTLMAGGRRAAREYYELSEDWSLL